MWVAPEMWDGEMGSDIANETEFLDKILLDVLVLGNQCKGVRLSLLEPVDAA